MYFKWIQLLHAIANHWEKELTENTINSQNLSYLNHHRIKSYQIYYIEKLTMKELYLISPQHETTTPISQKCFESMFRDLTLQWKHIYTLPRITTIDSKLWCFQYIILHNTLYLNEKLFLFHKHNTALCSFCNLEGETVIHLFVYCSKTKRLWCTIIEFFKVNLHILPLSPQSAIFCFLEADDKVFLVLNNLLLLFKYYVYVSRSSKVLSFEALLKFIVKVCKLEKIVIQSDERKRKLFTQKWNTILQNLWNFKKIWGAIPLNSVMLLIHGRSENSVTHLRWDFCFNSKHPTMFCLHGTLPLMFDSLHLLKGWGLVKFSFVLNCFYVSFLLLLLFICKHAK